jgi:molybdate transport system regulatory protein
MRGKRKKPRVTVDTIRLRGRFWVDIAGVAVFTDASADLLEQIDAHGSLSEAARQLHFSYRRAWLLLDAMNRHWPSPLVQTAIGGHHGGGARLTDLGQEILRAYRDVQLQLEHLLGREVAAFETPPK